jgi:Scramblase
LIISQIRVYDPLVPAPHSTSSSKSLVETSNAMIPDSTEQSAQISPLPLSDMRIIGEAQSQWAPLRRKYNLFLFHQPPGDTSEPTSTAGLNLSTAQQAQVAAQSGQIDEGQYVQFAYIDEPPLSWDFSLRSSSNKLIGSVNRNFAGFAREIFTDTGVYALRMDAAGLEEEASKRHIISKTAQQERAYKDLVGGEKTEMGMTLDQRAVILATAVTVDYDYFSRHSSSGGMTMMPLWMGGGGEAAEGGAAAGAAVGGAEAAEAGAGAVVGGAGRAVGGAAGAGEGAIAGAGTMAGYEAMQRGMGRGDDGQQATQPPPVDDASPQAPSQEDGDVWGQQGESQDGWGGHGQGAGRGEDVWGQEGQDPWSNSGGDVGGGGGGGGGSFWDIFGE